MTTVQPKSIVYPLYQDTPLELASSSVDVNALWSASNANAEKALENRTFFSADGTSATVVAVGKQASGKARDAVERREALRKTIATGVTKLKENGAVDIGISVHPEESHDAAVASYLSLYNYTLKTKPQDTVPKVQLQSSSQGSESSSQHLDWATGKIYAEAQNFARTLMEEPANMMTPTIFCERVSKEFEGLENVEIFVRDEAWAEEQGMRTFLSVTQGTEQPAKFLEIHYKGASDASAAPLALVGKGITFDSGGISLKPGAGMKLMRGDMGGAATAVSAALAIVKLKLPLNLIVATPLAENLPSGKATKPGDVIVAMNGKTVEVDNTDAEGRLVLSDALTYISRKKPHTLIDLATLTGAMVIALGEVFTGVFSTSDALFDELAAAGAAEHDRMWRMPIDEEGFGPQIYNSSNADLCNTGGRPGGSATAALFLKSFVEGIESVDGKEPALRWAHLDIAGTMEATRPSPYQKKGMTGRPVRALVEFARRSVQ